jgi:two-component system NtrC family sensor kinase
MERETERCSNIVRDLLDFARQREPALKPDVHINEVLEDTLSLLANQIALQEITLGKKYGTLPPIMADPMQLRQAFFNIIINACEAMPKMGHLILTTTYSKAKSEIKVEITDNGVGILEEHLPKIFDPFFTSKEMGTGLGLSVVYGIISSHLGTIEVKSKLRKGTTIIIALPTNNKQAEDTPQGTAV